MEPGDSAAAAFSSLLGRRLRRILCGLPRLRALLWRTLLQQTLLWLSGFSHHRRRRPAILCSRPWILVRGSVLRLEARPLDMATWSASLDPRALRRARILSRAGA